MLSTSSVLRLVSTLSTLSAPSKVRGCKNTANAPGQQFYISVVLDRITFISIILFDSSTEYAQHTECEYTDYTEYAACTECADLQNFLTKFGCLFQTDFRMCKLDLGARLERFALV